MPYVATMNTPGYLPMDDEPPVFATPEEGWNYLEDERRRGEDDYADPSFEGYSETLNILETLAEGTTAARENAGVDPDTGTGTVYGATPGYDGDHDLGIAYSVTWTDEPTGDEMPWTTGIVSTNGEAYETHWAVYDDAARWNGFLACPWIDALAVVEMLDGINAELTGEDAIYGHDFDFAEDGALILTDRQWAYEAGLTGEPYTPDRIEPNEDGLYSLGAYGWVWTAVESEDDADAQRMTYLLNMTNTEGQLR